ncbi:hypothetical protein F5888DRAFT_1653457 [Russula emetica]|nr:hypothetical protein F5888DRAFT_1653457 [Russula emetica]
MGTLRSRITIRCVSSSNLRRRRRRSSSSNCSTSRSTSRNSNHDQYVGNNNRRSGHYRETYLPTSTPFHNRLYPRPSMILLYSTSLLQQQLLNHHGSVLTVDSEEEEEELIERGERGLARGSAGRRNRCLYRLRPSFHAKFLIPSGVMMRVWRISMWELTRIVVINHGF